MRIKEIFRAIKGNGLSQGKPAIFVIIGDENEKEMSVDEVYNSLNVNDNSLIVFDGICDPLLYQQDLFGLIWLIYRHNEDCYFEIETTGMVSLHTDFFGFASSPSILRFNVSPQLLKSLEDKNWALDANFMVDVYESIVRSKSIFKFSVKQAGDFIDIGKFCEIYKIPRYAVWVTGVGGIGYQLEDMAMISLHCLANGYNYSLDLRKELHVS